MKGICSNLFGVGVETVGLLMKQQQKNMKKFSSALSLLTVSESQGRCLLCVKLKSLKFDNGAWIQEHLSISLTVVGKKGKTPIEILDVDNSETIDQLLFSKGDPAFPATNIFMCTVRSRRWVVRLPPNTLEWESAKAAMLSGFPQILHQPVDFQITQNSFNISKK
ncbi:hypothetical protein MKW98_023869 [Papaver atlanticum]|uniref:Uncharacterized protein n=1 Tax=Papaver atlanticum TaxID=357466 RepID=A0AAD4XN43_9MAGN|nr:hypothetical protein MKW98_023869 [Papaver atlanticum]